MVRQSPGSTIRYSSQVVAWNPFTLQQSHRRQPTANRWTPLCQHARRGPQARRQRAVAAMSGQIPHPPYGSYTNSTRTQLMLGEPHLAAERAVRTEYRRPREPTSPRLGPFHLLPLRFRLMRIAEQPRPLSTGQCVTSRQTPVPVTPMTNSRKKPAANWPLPLLPCVGVSGLRVG